MRWTRSRGRLAAALAVAALAAPASAAASPPPEPSEGGDVAPFASGLTNPRHVRFGPDGLLYVAEAGIGGDQPATTCPPVDNMFSQAGPVHRRLQRPDLPDPSRRLARDRRRPAAEHARRLRRRVRPVGHRLDRHGRMYAVIEGGGCSRGLPDHPAGIVRIKRDGSYRYVADISAFVRANPVANEPLCGPAGDCEPDGVPHSLLAVGEWLYVVETNHNSVLRVNPRTGAITRLYDLSVQDPAPIILTRRGHSFYLGGFDGLIQSFDHRFGPVSTFDEGYGPIVDMTFDRHRLYVLETFALETPWTPDTGRVVRRDRDGTRTLIATGLNFPIGMARGHGWRYGDALFVSTVSYGQGPVEGLGRIVRIGLERGNDD